MHAKATIAPSSAVNDSNDSPNGWMGGCDGDLMWMHYGDLANNRLVLSLERSLLTPSIQLIVHEVQDVLTPAIGRFSVRQGAGGETLVFAGIGVFVPSGEGNTQFIAGNMDIPNPLILRFLRGKLAHIKLPLTLAIEDSAIAVNGSADWINALLAMLMPGIKSTPTQTRAWYLKPGASHRFYCEHHSDSDGMAL